MIIYPLDFGVDEWEQYGSNIASYTTYNTRC